MIHGQDDERIGLLMQTVQQARAQYDAAEVRVQAHLAQGGCDRQVMREWAAAMLRLSRTLDAAAIAASCCGTRSFVGTIVP